MKPKTYDVRVKALVGYGSRSYHYRTHCETYKEALDEVERLFPGVDLSPTLFRLANPDKVQKVGNSDPVVIQDCDMYSTWVFEEGKRVVRRVPLGSRRSTEAEVSKSLHELFMRLASDYQEYKELAQRSYELAANRNCSKEKEHADKFSKLAKVVWGWSCSVWNEYSARESLAQAA